MVSSRLEEGGLIWMRREVCPGGWSVADWSLAVAAASFWLLPPLLTNRGIHSAHVVYHIAQHKIVCLFAKVCFFSQMQQHLCIPVK